MEKAVTDGKGSFSRSGATSKNVNWLSLIVPNDANTIKEYLEKFKETDYIPQSLIENNENLEYYQSRYDSSINWIQTNNHAVISNGPFYLDSYSPESRTIKVTAFDDDSYPFKKGEWSKFEKAEFPAIEKIDIKKVIQKGAEINIMIETKNSDSILYFLTNSRGENIISETQSIQDNNTVIKISPVDTSRLDVGANNIKIFAISNSVLKPDFYESSFIVIDSKTDLPIATNENVEFSKKESEYGLLIIPIIAFIVIVTYLKKRN